MMWCRRLSHSCVHFGIEAAKLLMARSKSKRAKRAPYSNFISTFAAWGWSCPRRTLREGAFLGLSRSLGDWFVELVWKGFLTPWAVDHLTVSDGRVASWPVILYRTFRWKRGRHVLQLEAGWRQALVGSTHEVKKDSMS